MIGEKIKGLREKKGLTMSAFAKELNCSPQYISQIEKNKQDVSREFIITISRYFNISIDSLLADDLLLADDQEHQPSQHNQDNGQISSEISITKESVEKIINSHDTLTKTNDKVVTLLSEVVTHILRSNESKQLNN